MTRPISVKCQECGAKHDQTRRGDRVYPTCFVGRNCWRKWSHYRNLDANRKRMRDNHRYIKYAGDHCVTCGSKDKLEVHHVIRQGEDGPDTAENTVTLCLHCHDIIHAWRTVLAQRAPE